MIYFDMDGVLARYDINGYTGDDPAFKKPGSHYFFNLEPDPTATEILKTLYKEIPGNVMVLTSVFSEREIRNEQTFDKINWLLKVFPDFDFGAHFLSCSTEKRNLISNIRGKALTKRDILIDDWNANLYAWANNGGTAIKYLNGLNSQESWPGEWLDARTHTSAETDNCLMKLRKIWFSLTQGNV